MLTKKRINEIENLISVKKNIDNKTGSILYYFKCETCNYTLKSSDNIKLFKSLVFHIRREHSNLLSLDDVRDLLFDRPDLKFKEYE